jgi:2-methylcitrate dehydratase PrpD
LRRQHDLKPQDVESITIVGGTGGTKLLCEPLESKRRPKVSIDGKYSIPFTTAVMMVKGNVTLRDYTDEGLTDPAVLAMADLISYREHLDSAPASGSSSGASIGRTAVEIRTRDGRVLVSQPDGVPGDPRHPVDWHLLETKFRDCVSFSRRRVPAQNVDAAIERIRNLEQLTDVGEIVRLLTPE